MIVFCQLLSRKQLGRPDMQRFCEGLATDGNAEIPAECILRNLEILRFNQEDGSKDSK